MLRRPSELLRNHHFPGLTVLAKGGHIHPHDVPFAQLHFGTVDDVRGVLTLGDVAEDVDLGVGQGLLHARVGGLSPNDAGEQPWRVECLESLHGLDPREGFQQLGLTDSLRGFVDRLDNGSAELLQRVGVIALTNSSIRP